MGQLCHVPVKRWMRKVLAGTGMHNKHRFASKNLLSAFDVVRSHDRATETPTFNTIVACEADKLTTQRPRHTLTAAVHVLPTWLVTAQEAQSASPGPSVSASVCKAIAASLQAEHDMDNLRPVDVLQRGRSHVTLKLQQIMATSPCRQQLRHNVRRTGWCKCKQQQVTFLHMFSS